MADHHLIAYSFSNISAKNYQSRLICVEVIMYNVIVVFLRHSVCLSCTIYKILSLISQTLKTSRDRDHLYLSYNLSCKC